MAQRDTLVLWLVLSFLLGFASACGDDDASEPDASAPLDSGADAGDSGLDPRDAEVDASDAAADADSATEDECCTPSASPSCCMAYGGPVTNGCGEVCDGMPPPGAPWVLGTDEHGCSVWIEPEEYDGVCCGCLPENDDAGL